MSLELWATIASVGTFVVIAATAIAAFVQLRHVRRSNQVAGLKSTFDMLLDPSIREIVNFVRHDLRERMKDQTFRNSLHETPVDRRDHPELYLCDLYNHIGAFVRNGLIDERIYLQAGWYNVNLYWGLLCDSVAEVRPNHPFTFQNFEWLASRARKWRDEHPSGDYPSDEPKMLPLTESTADRE